MSIILAQAIREIEGFGHAAFTDETNVHPIGLAVLVLAAIATFALPRRYALIPFVLIMTLIPSGQRIAIYTLDFTFLRLLVLAGAMRVVVRGEHVGLSWKPLDTAVVLWAAAAFVVANVRTNGGAFVYQSGVTVDALGGYFVARALIRNWADLNQLVRAVSLAALPVMLAFLVEQTTQRNLFAVFGGVPEITMVRENRLRCQGPYPHPILAGCYWAALLPLAAARWRQGGAARIEACLASGAALVIVYCSASSTPVFGAIAALVGGLFFRLRRHMRAVRWGLLALVIGLHLVMKAPVWHLISRVSAVGGSTSYFRYMLIDSFIKRFSEWALLGVNSTAHWFWGGQDVTNYYVAQGVNGGVLTLTLFIATIALAFGGVGRAWRQVESAPATCALAWALGVTMLVHVCNFFGVSYFGTVTGVWFLTLGAVGSLAPRKPAAAVAGQRHSHAPARASTRIVPIRPVRREGQT